MSIKTIGYFMGLAGLLVLLWTDRIDAVEYAAAFLLWTGTRWMIPD
jgi:hypothetical protein